MSLCFNTGLLHKNKSACIILEYLPSTNLKIWLGSAVLLEGVLPSSGTSWKLEARLSNRLSDCGLESPKKESILQSWGSWVRTKFSELWSCAWSQLFYVYANLELLFAVWSPCLSMTSQTDTTVNVAKLATFTWIGWENSPGYFVVLL